MKLNGSILVAAAMMVGSMGAIGCKSQDKITDTGNNVAAQETASVATPEDNPSAALVSDTELAAPTGVEKNAYWGHYWAYRAPPAHRYEPVGAYRAGYFWRPGYYGWSGRDYTWYGGAYYPERVGYRYVSPAWYSVGPRWGYRQGYWVRR
jgi:hypothetical protein